MPLTLKCFGNFLVTWDGQPVSFATHTARALLAYLALNAAQAHTREALSALFWPDQPQTTAFTNLRSTLARLRKALPNEAEALHITQHSIQFRPEAARVDASDFAGLLAECARHAHASLIQCDECAQRHTHAATLYAGELLQHLSLRTSQPFEEWLLLRREQFRRQALSALETLCAHHEHRGDYEALRRAAHQQLALEPWHEPAHRTLMRGLALAGDRNAALLQYEACRQVLAHELGIEPDAETTALYERIREGKLRGGSEAETSDEWHHSQLVTRLGFRAASSLVTSLDWGDMPAVEVFHGRAAEMQQLQNWLVQDHCRLVSVLGMGGMGKTTLAAAATQAAAPHFEVVIWRSLLNAPPLDEILRDWLQTVSQHTVNHAPESLDERLRVLLDFLRQRRCLLVLDNVESILQPSESTQPRTGEMRAGYEGYALLFERLALSEHRSCMLLTSREQPYALNRIGREMHAIRRLALVGLDVQAGSAILQGSGLQASHQDAALLVQNYSGNPLALQIVANTISDFFDGDVAVFWREHGFVFDGIRAVLDQQFARLSDVEREILIWLAIEREAVPVQALRENFVQQVTPSALVSALHALQARSMLEKTDDGLTLQNVLIEYMTERLIEGVCAEIADAASAGLWLNRFALLKAQAKEYVRQSQARLILQPVAERLLARLGKEKLLATVQAHLATLDSAPGYAAGNLLNILLHLNIDVTGYDFSKRAVWQAFLRESTIHAVNFSQADLRGSVFTQPFGRIFSVAYSPDSALIAGGSQDGTVFVWRADNGQSVGAYQGHTATVYGVAFSPDGTLLASASEDTTIRIWDCQAGQLRHVLRQHTGFVNSVAFSPDGRTLVSGSDDARVLVWNVATGQLIHTWLGNETRVVQVAFGGPPGAEGLWLACGGDDGKVRIWEAATGHLVQELDSPGHVIGLAFSKHPEISQAILASTGTEGIVRLWDVNEQGHWLARDLPKAEEDLNMTLAFSPDGALIASAGSGQFVRLRDARTGATVANLLGHRYVDMVAFSPDGQSLVSTGADRSVRVWHVRSMQMQHMLNGYGAWVSALVFDNKDSQRARHLQGNSFPQKMQEVPGTISSTESSDLWVSTIDGAQIRIWHAQTGDTRHTLLGHNKPVLTVAFSPSGRLLLSGETTGHVQIWDVPSGALRDTLTSHKGQIQALAANRADSAFAVAAYGEAVGLWPASGLAPVQQPRVLEHHDKAIYALAFGGPAGAEDSLLAGSGDLNTYVWDVATRQVRYVLSGHHTYCQSLAFSPDGALLASGGWDHQVCIWDMDTGQLRHSLRGHRGSILALAFSPDGRVLVSGSGDQHVCVWDVEHGTLVRTLQGHTAWLSAIAFNQAGTLLATGSANGAVKLWDMNKLLDTNPCLDTLYAKGPYAGMNITGVSGLNDAQKYALKALGAIEDS